MVRAPSNARRSGFTLTEMLVASALIIFMMWILSSAFEKGLTTFSQLKTAGDMQEKLRAAATVIRQDLISPHFDEGPEFVSGQRLDQTGWTPPAQGFFRVFQEGNSIPDGRDPDDPSGTLIHTRAPAQNTRGHILQFTVKLKGDRRDRYFMIDPQDSSASTDGMLHALSYPTYNARRRTPLKVPDSALPLAAEVPSSVFTTTWAEVTYFVRQNGATTGGVPLYSLYRRQNLLACDTGSNTSAIAGTSIPPNSDPKATRYVEASSWRTSSAAPGILNSQKTITAPSRRFAVQPSSRAGAYGGAIPRLQDEQSLSLLAGDQTGQAVVGSDLLLTDITDFEIKAMWDTAPSATLASPPPQPTGNPDFPFDQIPTGNNPGLSGARVFDTWSRNAGATGSAVDDYRQDVGTPGSPAEAWNGGYVTGTPPSDRSIPVKIRVRAIQIELRIWDVKSKQSRQITIIQDL